MPHPCCRFQMARSILNMGLLKLPCGQNWFPGPEDGYFGVSIFSKSSILISVWGRALGSFAYVFVYNLAITHVSVGLPSVCHPFWSRAEVDRFKRGQPASRLAGRSPWCVHCLGWVRWEQTSTLTQIHLWPITNWFRWLGISSKTTAYLRKVNKKP